METVILDSKQAAPEFKFIKNNYVVMNKARAVRFDVRAGEQTMTFVGTDDPAFSVLYGKLLVENELTKWLGMKDGSVEFKLTDMRIVRECLVKNIIGIEYTEDIFSYKYRKDEEEFSVVLERKPYSEYREIRIVDKAVPYLTHSAALQPSAFENEIFKLHIDAAGNAAHDETGRLLIEIPTKRITSFMKNSEYKIKYSDPIGNEAVMYVRLSSRGNDLSLYQVFMTI